MKLHRNFGVVHPSVCPSIHTLAHYNFFFLNKWLFSVNFLNSLPNDKFQTCSKFKAFADNKINVTQEVKFGME